MVSLGDQSEKAKKLLKLLKSAHNNNLGLRFANKRTSRKGCQHASAISEFRQIKLRLKELQHFHCRLVMQFSLRKSGRDFNRDVISNGCANKSAPTANTFDGNCLNMKPL
jgi:hypothetical protein